MDEKYISVVDDNDNVIGKGTITQHFKEGLLHRGSGIILINEKKQICFSQRSKHISYPLYWEMIFGGFVDYDEPYEVCAARELEEEAGIIALASDLKKILYTRLNFTYDSGVADDFFVTIFLYKTNKEVVIDPKEINATEWVSLEKIPHFIKGKKVKNVTEILLKEHFDLIKKEIDNY